MSSLERLTWVGNGLLNIIFMGLRGGIEGGGYFGGRGLKMHDDILGSGIFNLGGVRFLHRLNTVWIAYKREIEENTVRKR